MNRIALILVAAGRGLRAGGDRPKQWQALGSVRVIDRTLLAFQGLTDRVIVVLHADDIATADLTGVEIVAGGPTRAASVRAGLEALATDPPDLVLIHDAARPLIPRVVIERVLDALQDAPAAAPALAVTDALWRGTDDAVSGTEDRASLFRAQTPQGFRYPDILAAHRGLAGDAADDVEVARAAGMRVAIVEGHEDNLKITGPGDLARAAAILKGRDHMDIRTGNGFDVHKLGPGDHVWLCGIKVPHDHGLIGHSDADVGMHALTDAIYGALGQGDIGQHFPPSDMKWKGAASHIFLSHACALARESGFTITHGDVTLICERPKIGPHAPAMKAELARIMALTPDRISVKATTSEQLGFTGRGEGIAALATATLVKT